MQTLCMQLMLVSSSALCSVFCFVFELVFLFYSVPHSLYLLYFFCLLRCGVPWTLRGGNWERHSSDSPLKQQFIAFWSFCPCYTWKFFLMNFNDHVFFYFFPFSFSLLLDSLSSKWQFQSPNIHELKLSVLSKPYLSIVLNYEKW